MIHGGKELDNVPLEKPAAVANAPVGTVDSLVRTLAFPTGIGGVAEARLVDRLQNIDVPGPGTARR